MSNKNIGVAILAGGLSSRMGADKALLKIDGVSFLDLLANELAGFDEFLISVDDKALRPGIPFDMVEDIFPRCGPIGALYAVLSGCKSQNMAVVPCDVPFFPKELVCDMRDMLDDDTDAVIAEDASGRAHPLCGVYKKRCRDTFLRCIECGNYRLNDALKKLKVKKYRVSEESWRLANINTPEDYERLRVLFKQEVGDRK